MWCRKKSGSNQLRQIAKEFIIRVDVLPWDSRVVKSNIKLRTKCENEGKSLGAMDMLIAAHSVTVDAIFVSNDTAFYNVQHLLNLQDWTVRH